MEQKINELPPKIKKPFKPFQLDMTGNSTPGLFGITDARGLELLLQAIKYQTEREDGDTKTMIEFYLKLAKNKKEQRFMIFSAGTYHGQQVADELRPFRDLEKMFSSIGR